MKVFYAPSLALFWLGLLQSGKPHPLERLFGWIQRSTPSCPRTPTSKKSTPDSYLRKARLWRPEGVRWFSDVPGNVLCSVTPSGEVKVLIQNAGGIASAPPGSFVGPNGMIAGKDGAVLLCQHTNRRIVRVGQDLTMTPYLEKFEGHRIDASIRDTPQIRKLQFPVFSRGVVPSTTVNHYRFAGLNVPVTCAGVKVNPGDIITADEDGIVAVPKAHAADVLKKAQELDNTEHSTIPFIEKFRSIKEAVAKFGRI